MQLPRLLPALGLVQILSWGSLYYSLAVLAAPLRAELGFSELTVFGAFTLGMLLSGALAPTVGRWIDARGGRLPLTLGSVLAALAFALLALSHGVLSYYAGWLLAGAAMALCLYEPAFAALHRLAPARYRHSVTVLTLFGGFASTVFWPLSQRVLSEYGWRETFALFAVLHLLIGVPVHALLLPKEAPAAGVLPSGNDQSLKNCPVQNNSLQNDTRQHEIQTAETQQTEIQQTETQQASTPPHRAKLFWLATAFSAATMVFAVLSVFLIEALGQRGFAAADAVWIAAAIGPLQVLGRLLEWRFAGQVRAVTVGSFAMLGLLLAMLLLSTMPAWWLTGLLFAALYGMANGVMTVVRSAAPVELFGPANVGTLLGRLARPNFIAKALAPALFAALLLAGMSLQVALYLLIGLALLAWGAYRRVR
ncbi:MAG: MFS transporter [Permianibacter sp.]